MDQQAVELQGVVVIAGNYGSGKTEITINLAIQQHLSGVDVCVADLDLVNPYFRTREARHLLAAHRIDLVLPDASYLNADLPILSPAVAGLIRSSRQLVLLDAGGDAAGVTVLSALADSFRAATVSLLQVINPMRPATASIDGCRRIQQRIENAARLPVTGMIGNAHLMDETTVAQVMEGHAFCRSAADAAGVPLQFITAPADLIDRLDMDRIHCPVLPLTRYLQFPWAPPIAGAGARTKALNT